MGSGMRRLSPFWRSRVPLTIPAAQLRRLRVRLPCQTMDPTQRGPFGRTRLQVPRLGFGTVPIAGLYLNGGWCYQGFKAVPAGGWTLAHTMAKDEEHELNRCYALDRRAVGGTRGDLYMAPAGHSNNIMDQRRPAGRVVHRHGVCDLLPVDSPDWRPARRRGHLPGAVVWTGVGMAHPG